MGEREYQEDSYPGGQENFSTLGQGGLQDLERSERLRKALERNRLKQQQKNLPDPPPAFRPSARSTTNEAADEGPGLVTQAFGENILPFSRAVSKLGKIGPGLSALLDSPSIKDPLSSRFPFSRALVMGGWAFCLLLVFTLVFRQGGVMTYYAKQRLIEDRQFYLELLRKENQELTKSIRQIKTDRAFQKKMARDHLGLIAPDEYLILFSGE